MKPLQTKELKVSDYTYVLPEHKIAKYPCIPKDSSKLLVYEDGKIKETIFNKISDEFEKKCLLVFNDTKVVQARLKFKKETGGKVEVFCLQPANNQSWEAALNQTKEVFIECFIGGANKWKSGPVVTSINKHGKKFTLTATVINDLSTFKIVKLQWDDEHTRFEEILELVGETPLPPYLNREAEKKDEAAYQTYYAAHKGSVAAPTAGLHFTKNVFSELSKNNIDTLYVTLHVGAGTFKPLKGEKLIEHEMHKEWMYISKNQLEHLYTNESTIVAVGTTSTRFLETIYWIGVLIQQQKITSLINIELPQWEAYQETSTLTKKEALQVILDKLKEERLEIVSCATQIMIAPGYRFRMIRGLVTNFHQPGSTLLLLIAAAIGDDWKKVYTYALENDFRFLSYGDSSLLWIKN